MKENVFFCRHNQSDYTWKMMQSAEENTNAGQDDDFPLHVLVCYLSHMGYQP
jgi:hypothetical protein